MTVAIVITDIVVVVVIGQTAIAIVALAIVVS